MYGLNEISGIDSGSSMIHRVDSRVKLVYLVLASVVTVTLDNPGVLLALFAASALLSLYARIEMWRMRFMLILILLVVWGTMFSQSIFYYGEPRTVLVSLVGPDTPVLGKLFGELNIYREGFEYGAVQSLRFCTMLMAGLLFCWTTSISRMLDGMLALRVPYVLAFMTVTAVRFLPTIAEEVSIVTLSMRMRGGRISHPNPIVMVNNCLKLARPVFINCYRKSNILALSIQSRAFDPESERTGGRNEKMSVAETGLIAAGVCAVLAIVILKLLFLLYVNDIYYNTHLRMVYEFTRLWL